MSPDDSMSPRGQTLSINNALTGRPLGTINHRVGRRRWGLIRAHIHTERS
jgi:hypothetical protein